MTIKERVLHIAEQKGLQKVGFFQDLGLSYANFKGPQKQSALSSDALVHILHKYADISPAWLLMGEGAMMRAPAIDPDSMVFNGEQNHEKLNTALQQLVTAQEKTIQLLEREISSLERELQASKK